MVSAVRRCNDTVCRLQVSHVISLLQTENTTHTPFKPHGSCSHSNYLPNNLLTFWPPDISIAQAKIVIEGAISNATALSVPENVAIVDPSGLLVGFLRMDNAYPGSIDISQKKARTAVLFNGLTSATLGVAALPGGGLYGIEETNGGLIAFGGG